MGNQRGVGTFFIILFLLVLIVLQILAMVQSDRLYERINSFENVLKNISPVYSQGDSKTQARHQQSDDEGDWLIWRIGAEPATLNPITSTDLYAQWITLGNIFESLLETDLDTAELKPMLAES